MKHQLYFLLLIALVSCQGPEPRRPVKVNSGSVYKESIARSKALLAKEEQMIQDIIAKDSLHTYLQSAAGSWYYYNVKDDTSNLTLQPNDVVTLTYNMVSLDNDTIYTMRDIGILQFKADKLDLFQGLRNSVPLLKENETATFLFPSSLGYGYYGDKNKIGTNVPLKSTLTILKIDKQQDSIN